MARAIPLDFKQAKALCSKVDLLSGSSAEASRRLDEAIEAGWSPYLHCFAAMAGSLVASPAPDLALHFGKDPDDMALFSKTLDAFPAFIECWRLLPTWSESWRIPKNDGPCKQLPSPWLAMAGPQKSWLIVHAPEVLRPPRNATGDGRDLWLCAMSVALVPKKIRLVGASASVHAVSTAMVPFYGYFESEAWSALKKAEPSLARELCVALCCVAGLAKSTESWQGVAAAHGAGLASVDLKIGEQTRSMAWACAVEHLLQDRPERLMPLMECIESKPMEAEAALFASNLPETRRLSDALESDPYQKSTLGGGSECRVRRSSLAPLGITYLFEPIVIRSRCGRVSAPEALFPLFSMSAFLEAQSCWKSMQDRYGSPWGIGEMLIHRCALPSPVEIKSRMERHMLAASGGLEGSVDILRKNLQNEGARARRLLAKLPLPSALLSDLLGEPVSGSMSSEAQGLIDRFDEAARSKFERACEAASRRVKEGRRASLELPVAYDWMSLAIRMGAKPSFFASVAPPGAIARACSFMDHAYSVGIHEKLPESECAFVVADELLASTAHIDEAAAPRKAPSL